MEDAERTTALRALSALDDARAVDPVALDVRRLCGFADYLIVASAPSDARLSGLARRLEKALVERGVKLLSRQGDGSGWLVYDAGTVVVHLLDASLRDYYQLEHLWGDAPRLDAPRMTGTP